MGKHIASGIHDQALRLQELCISPQQIAAIVQKPPAEIAYWVGRFERLFEGKPEPSTATAMDELSPVPRSQRHLGREQSRDPRLTEAMRACYVAQDGLCFYCDQIAAPDINDPRLMWSGLVPPSTAPRSLLLRGWRKATVEHLVRRADGGGDEPENLVMACSFCNSARGSRAPGEHRTFIAYLMSAGLHPLSPGPDWTIGLLRKAMKEDGKSI